VQAEATPSPLFVRVTCRLALEIMSASNALPLDLLRRANEMYTRVAIEKSVSLCLIALTLQLLSSLRLLLCIRAVIVRMLSLAACVVALHVSFEQTLMLLC
jgi:hypothetical protein